MRELLYVSELERDARCLPFGRLVLTAEGGVRYASPTAAVLLQRNDGLRIEHGRLTAGRARHDDTLLAALRAAGQDARRDPMYIALPRPSGRTPWTMCLRAASLATAPQSTLHASGIEVILLDPDAAALPPAAMAERYLELTRREARVLARLMLGESPAEAAQALGLATATVRLHVEHLLRKSGTHRQSDLLLRVLAPFLARLPDACVTDWPPAPRPAEDA